MVMRQDRLKEIAKDKGPKGPSRDMADLNYWSNRASANSPIPSRATGKMRPDSTKKNSDPPRSHDIDARLAAKSDRNNVGSSFMPGVRRGES